MIPEVAELTRDELDKLYVPVSDLAGLPLDRLVVSLREVKLEIEYPTADCSELVRAATYVPWWDLLVVDVKEEGIATVDDTCTSITWWEGTPEAWVDLADDGNADRIVRYVALEAGMPLGCTAPAVTVVADCIRLEVVTGPDRWVESWRLADLTTEPVDPLDQRRTRSGARYVERLMLGRLAALVGRVEAAPREPSPLTIAQNEAAEARRQLELVRAAAIEVVCLLACEQQHYVSHPLVRDLVAVVGGPASFASRWPPV
jgi:hypothetical protein